MGLKAVELVDLIRQRVARGVESDKDCIDDEIEIVEGGEEDAMEP